MNFKNIPYVPIIGWGIATLIAVRFVGHAGGFTLLLGAYLLIKAIIHALGKTKPIYSSKGIYKRDRRFKTGQRHIGSRKVKTGSEPLLPEEKKAQLVLAGFEAVYGLSLIITAWPYIKF